MSYKRGQLFLIEIIIAISVLLILVSTMFQTQTITPPPNSSDLDQVSEGIFEVLTEYPDFWNYLAMANYSFYILGDTILDNTNTTKEQISNVVSSNIPLIANFKMFTYRFDPTINSWQRVDIINQEAYTPTGTDISVSEFYTPGVNGVFDQYRIVLNIWFEV